MVFFVPVFCWVENDDDERRLLETVHMFENVIVIVHKNICVYQHVISAVLKTDGGPTLLDSIKVKIKRYIICTHHNLNRITTNQILSTYSNSMRIQHPLIRISNLMYQNHLAVNHRRLVIVTISQIEDVAGGVGSSPPHAFACHD